MNQLTPQSRQRSLTTRRATKSVTIYHPLHPRIISGINGTVAGVTCFGGIIGKE